MELTEAEMVSLVTEAEMVALDTTGALECEGSIIELSSLAVSDAISDSMHEAIWLEGMSSRKHSTTRTIDPLLVILGRCQRMSDLVSVVVLPASTSASGGVRDPTDIVFNLLLPPGEWTRCKVAALLVCRASPP